jgi:prolyl-tRNA synthetase
MKASLFFFKTQKEIPNDCDVISHQLMERAGYLRKLARGLFMNTPLMMRVMKKLNTIIRQELDLSGCQEVMLPQLQPAQIWKDSGRWAHYRAENLLYTLRDREMHDYCLGPTHEEVAVLLVKNWITSYRQLPVNVYQIASKFRDEIRPRFGVMRAKEFMMKDGYSFCSSYEQMDEQYQLMRRAYSSILDRLHLRYAIVEADGGTIGKGRSEEFQILADIGEDALLVTSNHAANVEALKATPEAKPYTSKLQEAIVKPTVATSTIEKLTKFLQIPDWLILKTLLYRASYEDREEFIAVSIRGDREVNEIKLKNWLSCLELELASAEDLMRIAGVKPGFFGPKDLQIQTVADLSVQAMRNFTMAINENDQHMLNANWERDLKMPTLVDLLLAKEGDTHLQTGEAYKAYRGIEVGHIFNLGQKYSQAMEAHFVDAKGESVPYYMGCYGIGVGRLLASVIEQSHDVKGIIWPKALAPFQALISAAKMTDPTLVQAAETLYRQLTDLKIEVLLDDREERLGFKLKDSDLIGLPYKIIFGNSFLNDSLIEIEPRSGDKILLNQDDFINWAKTHLI